MIVKSKGYDLERVLCSVGLLREAPDRQKTFGVDDRPLKIGVLNLMRWTGVGFGASSLSNHHDKRTCRCTRYFCVPGYLEGAWKERKKYRRSAWRTKLCEFGRLEGFVLREPGWERRKNTLSFLYSNSIFAKIVESRYPTPPIRGNLSPLPLVFLAPFSPAICLANDPNQPASPTP